MTRSLASPSRVLLLGLVLLLGIGREPEAVWAQSLSPDAFATGFVLTPQAEQPVHVALVPPAVYRTATRADLGDVRVFNAAGEVVPHALYRDAVPGAVRADSVRLPLFPLRGTATDPNRLRVQVERTPEGTLVQVREAPTSAPLRAYVLDASGLDRPVEALQLDWPDTTRSFVTDVQVEASDDLRQWRPLATATVAALRYAGDTLVRDAIALPGGTGAPYLRLRWAGAGLPELDAATARTTARAEPDRQWMPLTAISPEPHVYQYDTGGVLPIDRLAVQLPQTGTLARTTVASADTPDGPWRTRWRGLLYRLRVDGYDLATPPLVVSQTADRYWRFTVDPSGGGVGGEAPLLEAGWTPERLLFVPRGDGPFTLAVGRAQTEPAGFAPSDILSLLPGEARDRLLVSTVEVGAGVELGGPARLVAAPDRPWGRYAVWAVLALGVVVLAVLAVRLLRQIEADRRAERPDAA